MGGTGHVSRTFQLNTSMIVLSLPDTHEPGMFFPDFDAVEFGEDNAEGV